MSHLMIPRRPPRIASSTGVLVLAVVLAMPAVLSAQALSEEIPIVGGTAATARSLGIDQVPDRPRFLAELVRVIYDAREGRNVETDAKLARLANHHAVTDRLMAELTNLPAGTTGISLGMASAKDDSARLKDFLDLAGLKLREKNRTLTV